MRNSTRAIQEVRWIMQAIIDNYFQRISPKSLVECEWQTSPTPDIPTLVAVTTRQHISMLQQISFIGILITSIIVLTAFNSSILKTPYFSMSAYLNTLKHIVSPQLPTTTSDESSDIHKMGTDDGWHGVIKDNGRFPPEAGRYHLYIGELLHMNDARTAFADYHQRSLLSICAPRESCSTSQRTWGSNHNFRC